jgi:hypothetical protein
MRNISQLICVFVLLFGFYSCKKDTITPVVSDGYVDILLNDSITKALPMTGIVLWNTSSHKNTDAISLEFSYMLFEDVVVDSGVYNWDKVEEKLNAIASRKHQAIFRFRYVYPAYETSVPQYIKNRDDYHEIMGLSEGHETWFPDWTNEELKRFSKEFYTNFAEKYDKDPRLAFVQVGFGLWGEYHIYDGPFELGVTFPSKEFQEEFFKNLEVCFINTPWSISIDAADDTYSPFSEKPLLKEIPFGLFDDSFMHASHSGYNTSCWNFFDRNRYQLNPVGGEFSYYSDYDQQHVLDTVTGPHGKSYEWFTENFHISYILGNDQPRYQTMDRIKEASNASGYKFKIVSFRASSDSSKVVITNIGVAPIYYDAFVAVNYNRSDYSLKTVLPGDTISLVFPYGGVSPSLSIECDRLVDGQKIEFEGNKY